MHPSDINRPRVRPQCNKTYRLENLQSLSLSLSDSQGFQFCLNLVVDLLGNLLLELQFLQQQQNYPCIKVLVCLSVCLTVCTESTPESI